MHTRMQNYNYKNIHINILISHITNVSPQKDTDELDI